MPKIFLKGMGILGLLIFIYGCSSSKVHLHSYIDTKKRVDQEITGNAGYIHGTPSPEALQKSPKQTRQVFVVEFDKENKEEQEEQPQPKKIDRSSSSTLMEETQRAERVSTHQPKINIPPIEEMTSQGNVTGKGVVATTSFVEYKIEKDDTLQKISKKFYKAYNKWPRIYEANRDVLKSPDHIKPGLVIKIPQP